MVAARGWGGWGRGGMGSTDFNGSELWFEMMKKFWLWTVVIVAQQCE